MQCIYVRRAKPQSLTRSIFFAREILLLIFSSCHRSFLLRMALLISVRKRDRTAIVYKHFYHTRSPNDKNATEKDENATFTCGWKEFTHCAGITFINQPLLFTPHEHNGNVERCPFHIEAEAQRQSHQSPHRLNPKSLGKEAPRS